ncbi:MAG: hypothetical protein CSB55_07260 [Candidatus Cloacimonadota bacterium]|nr:MAG: hypothetical protein CSB55_07260 [Candidatus Cloacimonadota bacterium]
MLKSVFMRIKVNLTFLLLIAYGILNCEVIYDLGCVNPGNQIDVSIELPGKSVAVIPGCNCITNLVIKDKKLEFKINIENNNFFFPKKIYIEYADSTNDLISINGTLKEIFPEINYFYSSECSSCKRIKEILKKNAELNKYYVNLLDINKKENIIKLFEIKKKYHIDKIKTNVVTYYSNTGKFVILNGKKNILKKISSLKKKYIAVKHINSSEIKDENIEFESDFLVLLGLSGLIDGINPCAFSTIIFFITLLNFLRIDKKVIFQIGTSFSLGIFVTYIFIGIGLINILEILSKYSKIKIAFDYLIIGSLIFFIIISLYDLFIFFKYKKYDKVMNRLPLKFKQKIHKVIRNGINKKYIIITFFVVGIQIALIEGICTGQIYVPLLKVIFQEHNFNFYTLILIFYYNIAFITPLILVWGVFFYFGDNKKLKKIIEKQFIFVKVIIIILLLAILFYLLNF